MYKNLLNITLFNLGWFACVAGGDGWALAAVPAILLVHWRFVARDGIEWLNIALAAVIGICIDTTWQLLGVLEFSNNFFGVPFWLLALWFLFPTTLNHSLGWLQQRLALAATLGAVFGPLSYIAGIALGAATSPLELQWLALCLSMCWMILTPGLLLLMRSSPIKLADANHQTVARHPE